MAKPGEAASEREPSAWGSAPQVSHLQVPSLLDALVSTCWAARDAIRGNAPALTWEQVLPGLPASPKGLRVKWKKTAPSERMLL